MFTSRSRFTDNMVATTKEPIDESVSFNRGAQFADKIFDSAQTTPATHINQVKYIFRQNIANINFFKFFSICL